MTMHDPVRSVRAAFDLKSRLTDNLVHGAAILTEAARNSTEQTSKRLSCSAEAIMRSRGLMDKLVHVK